MKWYKTNKKKKIRNILIILAAAIVLAAVIRFVIAPKVTDFFNPYEPFTADEETLRDLAPFEEDKAAAILGSPAYASDETWAIYVYMVGADLEDRGMDELSDFTHYLTEGEYSRREEEYRAARRETVRNFTDEVTAMGAEIPDLFYTPVVRVNSGAGSYETTANVDSDGFATGNFNQLLGVEYAPNVKVVVQTGGAKRWQTAMINPNRTQRWLFDESNDAALVYDGPVENMADPGTLTEFLRFCTDNYDADHKIAIFWNHGGGIQGYGQDSIFGGEIMSLKQMAQAFEDADCGRFEAIGFDACLMGTVEVAKILSPYAKYLYASEESEPACGWNYSALVEAFNEADGMNGAKLGLKVTDSYIERALSQNAEYGYVCPATFSVIDLEKAETLYSAYDTFAGEALKAVADDSSMFAKLSRAAQASVAYGGSAYRIFNLIDLGQFMVEAQDLFPAETQKILGLLDETVLYTRASSYLSESTGIAVYYPTRIEGVGGLYTLLDYIENVSDSDACSALYYYKIAGCLNETLADCAEEYGAGEVPLLDYSVLRGLQGKDLECLGDGNMSMKLSSKEMSLVQGAEFALAEYNPETGDITYYGNDAYAFIDDDGTAGTDFRGEWMSFGGELLPLEVISQTGDNITFRTPVNYNGTDCWLITGYNAETDECSLLGIQERDTGDTAARFTLGLKDKGVIMIEYESGNLWSNASSTETRTVIYHDGMQPESKVLPDGNYLEHFLFEDLRSDTYYSPIVSFVIKNGEISSQAVEASMSGYDKD